MDADEVDRYVDSLVRALMPRLRGTTAVYERLRMVAPPPQETAQDLLSEWEASWAERKRRAQGQLPGNAPERP
jgi:hypothetical protein